MKGELGISESTRVRVQQAKRYIERKYNLGRLKEEQRAQSWKCFEEKVRQLNLSLEEKQLAKRTILQQQMQQLRRRREKVSKRSFQSICVIGRGAFGEVRLCRQRKTGRVVAIKCLNKKEMIKKNQQAHLKAERDFLVGGGDWVVNLLYSFQDQNCLYLVMQYLPGSDLMNLLIARNVLAEPEARFYAAELVLAIECIHRRNYIHRDLKPDNVLIDERGHIKLSDFGLCKETETSEDSCTSEAIHDYVPAQIANVQTFKRYLQKYESRRQRSRKLAFSAVGTPDYIAPEMLKRVGYTQLVDWWALGVIVYEMLIGYAPFSADNNDEIYYKIENYEEFLYFPPEATISFDVIDFISRLLSDQSLRLGRNGAEEVRGHMWFREVDWDNVRSMNPPFVPNLESSIDTKYFDKYEETEPWLFEGAEESHKKDFNFIGYTYKLQNEVPRNIMKEQLQKLQRQKNEEKERQKIDMKKKKKIHITGQSGHTDINYSKNIFQRLHLNQNGNAKSQIQTQRSKGRKSKSPLQTKDTNRMKTKQSTSKSPLKGDCKTERGSGLVRKVAPLNLQSLGLNSMIYGSSELGKTMTTRRSTKKNK